MLTIRKKLAEQAASQAQEAAMGGEGGVKRRLSFRSQLLTAGERGVAIWVMPHPFVTLDLLLPVEAGELGEVLPSKLCSLWLCLLLSLLTHGLHRDLLCAL